MVRRHRVAALVSSLALALAATLGVVTAVGADEVAAPEGNAVEQVTPEESPAPAEEPQAPAEEPAPEEPAPPAETPSTGPSSSSSSESLAPSAVGETTPIRAESHTTHDEFTECQPTGSTNPWESDDRADPNGQCTDGNVGDGGSTAVLADCTAAFGSSVTHFYNSQNADGTGNDDVTGAITAHTGGGTQVNVTPDAGVVIDGVFVKAGNGYNAYIGNEPNMIGPLVGNWDPTDDNPSPNFANISHYVVCYHVTDVAATGGLTVDKNVVGTPGGNPTFTVTINCDDGTTHDGTIVFDANGDITTAGDFDAVPITGIPVGTSCTVTETLNGNADDVQITGSPAVIAAGDPQQVTVTNTFLQAETGGLTVDKIVTGDPDGDPTFTVSVNCDDGTDHDGTLVFNSAGVLTSAGTIDTLPIIGIPAGTSCTVTETDDGGAIDTVITGSPAVIVASIVSEVTVENVFSEVAGDITVTLNVNKEVTGTGTPEEGTTFTVHVSCTGATTIEQDLTFTYSSGLGVQSISRQIPTLGELTCTVTETGTGGTTLVGYKIDGGSIQGGAPVIVLDLNRPSAGVTVVNDPGVEVGGVSTEVLPFTGSTTDTLIKLAALLLIIGVGALALTRYRRRAPLLGRS